MYSDVQPGIGVTLVMNVHLWICMMIPLNQGKGYPCYECTLVPSVGMCDDVRVTLILGIGVYRGYSLV